MIAYFLFLKWQFLQIQKLDRQYLIQFSLFEIILTLLISDLIFKSIFGSIQYRKMNAYRILMVHRLRLFWFFLYLNIISVKNYLVIILIFPLLLFTMVYFDVKFSAVTIFFIFLGILINQAIFIINSLLFRFKIILIIVTLVISFILKELLFGLQFQPHYIFYLLLLLSVLILIIKSVFFTNKFLFS